MGNCACVENVYVVPANSDHEPADLSLVEGDHLPAQSIAFAFGESPMAAVSSAHRIQVCDLESGVELYRLEASTEGIFSMAFDAGGLTLACAGLDKVIRLWNTASCEITNTLIGHTQSVRCVMFSPMQHILASGGDDWTIRLWNVQQGKRTLLLRGHKEAVTCLDFSANGQMLVSGSADNTAIIWRAATGEQIQSLIGYNEAVSSVAFSPDGKVVATGSKDKLIYLWSRESGNISLTIVGHADTVMSLAFTSNGMTLVSGGADATIRLWNTTNAQEMKTISTEAYPVIKVSVNPDSSMLAYGCENGKFEFNDLASYGVAAYSPIDECSETQEGAYKELSQEGDDEFDQLGSLEGKLDMYASGFRSQDDSVMIDFSNLGIVIRDEFEPLPSEVNWKSEPASLLETVSIDLSAEAESLLIAETKKLKGVKHEAVVMTHGLVYTPKSTYCLLTELIPKYTLYDLLHSGVWVEWKTRLQLMRDVVYGLQALHSAGFIHRNLNTRNILVRSMRAKISGFGLNRLPPIQEQLKAKLCKLTPWSDPDLCENGWQYSKATDMYSLGSVMWEIITQKVPYSEEEAGIGLIGIAEDSEGGPQLKGCLEELCRLAHACLLTETGRFTVDDVAHYIANKKYEVEVEDDVSEYAVHGVFGEQGELGGYGGYSGYDGYGDEGDEGDEGEDDLQNVEGSNAPTNMEYY